jgi:hypothetical protein
MTSSLESALRLVNLTTSGLLAGSLGFGEAALMPGWEEERPREVAPPTVDDFAKYFNAIGPIALATSMTLALASRDRSFVRKALDTMSAVSLAGVLGTTMLVTVPINRKLDTVSPPADYADDESESLSRNWARAHTLRTALGIGAFVFAAASSVMRKK